MAAEFAPNDRPDPSANATKHGLTARRPLHEEEAERARVMYDHFIEKLRPEGPAEDALVAAAAVEYVRYLRCLRAHESRIRPAIAQAVREWKEKKRHAVRKKAQALADEPDRVVEELSESAFGIDWLLRRWSALREALGPGRSWEASDLQRAVLLLGRRPGIPLPLGSEADRLSRLAALAFPGSSDVDGSDAEPEARAGLLAMLDDQIARLNDLRAIVWEEVDAPELEDVERSSLQDVSKEGQLRYRYLRDALRDHQKSITTLTRFRAERSKMIAREARMPAPPPDDRPAYVAPRRFSPNEPASAPVSGPPIQPNPSFAKGFREASPDRPSSTTRRTEPRPDRRTEPSPTADRPSPASWFRTGVPPDPR